MEWSYEKRPIDEFNALEELEDEGVKLTYQPDAEKMELRDLSWSLGREKGYYKGMNEDLMKLADALRNEPYDQNELQFP